VHPLTALAGGERYTERDAAPTNRLRTEGTDHLLSAGRAVGVRRFVAQGVAGTGAYARSGGPIKSEEDPLDPEPVREMRQILAAAIEQGTRGVYNVVDDDSALVAEWLPALAQTLGAKKPMRVPRFIGRLFAGEAGVVMMTEIRGASNAEAKRELWWRSAHASWSEGFAAA
jgi:nucleoside-diphosphate-sugar epimerase